MVPVVKRSILAGLRRSLHVMLWGNEDVELFLHPWKAAEINS